MSSALSGPWYRVQAIIGSPGGRRAEHDFVSVLPAVLSAAQRGAPFVIGWLSRGHGAPLELITNAGPVRTDADDAPALGDADRGMLYPGGARGVVIGDDWLSECERLVWTPCPGRQAPPLADADKDDPGDDSRPTLFESTLVTLMARPFCWLLIAEPTELLDLEVSELRTQLNVLRRYEDASERSRFDVERSERRMQELDAFREAGLWNVRLLAGAATPAELRQIAPVLVGSVDMSRHPYRLRTALSGPWDGDTEVHSFADALAAKVTDSTDDASAPFAATAGTLAALAGMPRREVPGLRVLDAGYFDVTSETGADGDQPSIDLGMVLDGQERAVGSFRVPLSTLNRHAFVTGATGGGKSQTVRHLLEQLTRAGIPWLAIEPAKSEYAAMGGRIEPLGADVTVVNPSDPDVVPLSVNPLAPEPGYPVQAHIDMVRALFQAAFDAEEPFPQIMSQALQRVYEDNGWDVVTGGGVPDAPVGPATPTLEQLQKAAIEVIEDVGYGKDLGADVRGFVDVRLRSLRIGSAGRFFEGGHPVNIKDLLNRNVVLAIEDVANDEDKAFLMGTLIIRIVEHLRMRARSERFTGLAHAIVIEEAHRLLRDRGEDKSSSHAVELFAGMLAEIRAYGEGIVVAEQIPTKLVPDVVKNTALKVVHRLPAHDDRQLVGAAMNLDDEQSRQVVSLEPGVAAVFTDGMDRPLRIRVPLGEGRERVLPSPVPPIADRRSHACGVECREQEACTLMQLRQADLAAAGDDAAWLRAWVEALVLAYLTNHPRPVPPDTLRRQWDFMEPRTRECLLATVIERAVGSRATALRRTFAPDQLTSTLATDARRLLDRQDDRFDVPPGTTWVVPQIRWLHELEVLFPRGERWPDLWTHAPAGVYDLSDVPGEAGVPIGHRMYALRRHPLSAEIAQNRNIAWRVIRGDDDHHDAFMDDLDTLLSWAPEEDRSDNIAEQLHTAWLPAVLSWPGRFIVTPHDDDDAPSYETTELGPDD